MPVSIHYPDHIVEPELHGTYSFREETMLQLLYLN
jgi:hypothetical protein